MSQFNFTWWKEQLSNTKNKSKYRYRNFVTIVYPPEICFQLGVPCQTPWNWRDILASFRVPYFISPLHDKDINAIGQTQKRPHYHVMIMFDNVKSYDQVIGIIDSIGGVGGEIVQSLRGQARYLCHLDNPEKARYNPADVVSGFGADYDSIINSASDLRETCRLMREFIRCNDIIDFDVFYDYCDEHMQEWAQVLDSKRTYAIKEYINARYKRRCRQDYYNVKKND